MSIIDPIIDVSCLTQGSCCYQVTRTARLRMTCNDSCMATAVNWEVFSLDDMGDSITYLSLDSRSSAFCT